MLTLTVREYLARYEAGENSDIMAKRISEELGKPFAASTLVRRMKNLGYKWDNSAKKWNWTKGDEPQPLERNLLETIRKPNASKGGRPKKKRPNPEEIEQLLSEDERRMNNNAQALITHDEQRMNNEAETASGLDFHEDSSSPIHLKFIPESSSSIHREFIPSSSVVHHQFTPEETEAIRAMLAAWQSGKLAEQTATVETVDKKETVYERLERAQLGDKTRKTIVIADQAGEALDQFCEKKNVNKWEVVSLAILDFIEKYE